MKKSHLALACTLLTVGLAGCSDSDSKSTASVRVLHASADAPAVDVAIDGKVELSGVSFQQGSGYLTVPAGTRELSLLVDGEEVLSQSVDLDKNGSYSVIASNDVAELEFKVVNDTEFRDNDVADVTVVHSATVVDGVDINVTAPDAELPQVPTLAGVPFGADATLEDVAAGDYRVRIAPADTSTIAYDSGTLPIGGDVTVVAVNSTKGASPVSLLAWSDAETPVATVLDNSAEVRIVHAVDEVTVDVFAGGQLLKEDFTYTSTIPYTKVTAGSLDVAVSPANGGLEGAIETLSGSLTLERGESYTVIAAGDVNNLTETRLIPLTDVREPADSSLAYVRLVHASPAPAADPVDIYVVAAGDPVTGEPLLNDVEFTQDSGYLDVPEATYDVVIAANGDTTAAVPGTEGLELAAGSITTALAIGADVGSLEPLLLDDKR
jgi:hypothetical protein